MFVRLLLPPIPFWYWCVRKDLTIIILYSLEEPMKLEFYKGISQFCENFNKCVFCKCFSPFFKAIHLIVNEYLYITCFLLMIQFFHDYKLIETIDMFQYLSIDGSVLNQTDESLKNNESLVTIVWILCFNWTTWNYFIMTIHQWVAVGRIFLHEKLR